ncbi:hypothetical protein MTP99_013896 [Tenebrio molitor]|jgi:hypothetical protein|nr:hypothetical protein MTP99_013896 [Tenebrio molitor]
MGKDRRAIRPGRGSQRVRRQARRPTAYKRKLLPNYRKASPKSETFTLVMLPSSFMLMPLFPPRVHQYFRHRRGSISPGDTPPYAFLNVLIEEAWIPEMSSA